jgi:hypothetical protein
MNLKKRNSRNRISSLTSIPKGYYKMAKEINSINRSELIIECNKISKDEMIIIDGYPGSGKSNLSYYLGAELRRRVFNLDDFIRSNGNVCYLDRLDWDSFLSKMTSYKKPSILEGIFILEIIEKINSRNGNLNTNNLIYCKGKELVSHEIHCSIGSENNIGAILARTDIPKSRIDLLIYNNKFKPFDKAKIIYTLDKDCSNG